MRQFLLTSLAALSLIALSPGVFAQSSNPVQTGEPTMLLTGVVYDHNGSVIVTGTSIVASGAGEKSYQTTTDEEGIYRLKLPLGIYQIKVSAPHFCPSEVARFRVVDSTHGKMSLDFVLEVSDAGEGCRHSITVENKSKRKAGKKSRIIIE
jgi:hypothetical protein